MKSFKPLSTFVLILIAATWSSAALAQFEDFLVPQYIKSAASAMREYHAKEQEFPRGGQKMEQMARFVYRKVNVNPLPPTEQSKYTEQGYLKLGNICVAYDPSITNAPIDTWRNSPPASWRGTFRDIVVLSDGQSTYLVWAVALDGTPLRDLKDKQQVMIMYDHLSATDSDGN